MITVGGPVPLTHADISAAIDRADAIAAAHFDAAGVEQVCDWAEGHR